MPQAKIKINAAVGSNTDLPINTLVQLDNLSVGGEITYLWSILDQPPGTVDALSATTIINPTFTPKKEGSYLIKLIVNQGLPDEVSDTVTAAVRQLKTRYRVPAAGETLQEDASDGWAVSVNTALRGLDNLQADPGLVLCQTTIALSQGQVGVIAGFATIKAGLPGSETIPQVSSATGAGSQATRAVLGVFERTVTGASVAVINDLVYMRVFGLAKYTVATAAAIADPLYVANTGFISATPGNFPRRIGTANTAGPNFRFSVNTLGNASVQQVVFGVSSTPANILTNWLAPGYSSVVADLNEKRMPLGVHGFVTRMDVRARTGTVGAASTITLVRAGVATALFVPVPVATQNATFITATPEFFNGINQEVSVQCVHAAGITAGFADLFVTLTFALV